MWSPLQPVWPKNILDANKKSIELSQISQWVVSLLDDEHPKDELWKVIEDHEQLIRRRISTISPVINKFAKKIRTDPTRLLDNLYGNPEIRQLRLHVQTKNNCLYHYVKDQKDYVPFLLNERKLNMSPPSKFKDEHDVNFEWCRDILDISVNKESIEMLSGIMEFAQYSESMITDSVRLFSESSTFLDKAREITRVVCLCNVHDNLDMWGEYAGNKGICIQLDKKISNSASRVAYNPTITEPFHVKEQFEELFGDFKTNEKKIAKSFGRLFSLICAEPFLDPYFKAKTYDWEDEWRIVKPHNELKYDSEHDRWFMQLEPKNIKRVWFSSQMDPTHYEEYCKMCDDAGIKHEVFQIPASQ